jgi:hypothetical protein
MTDCSCGDADFHRRYPGIIHDGPAMTDERARVQAWMAEKCPHLAHLASDDSKYFYEKHECPDCLLAYGAERARGTIRDLLDEVAVEFDDERVGYVSVQITRGVWNDMIRARREGPG